jgi:hypothetical protein
MLISCRSLGGKKFIVANAANECYSSTFWYYFFIFVFPTLILWTVIIPLFMLAGLKYANKENKLESSFIMYQYGFLYKEYKR